MNDLLTEARNKIDSIDNQLITLYVERMAVAKVIGEYKAEKCICTENPIREKEILNKVVSSAPQELNVYVKQLFETLFSTSKAYQSRFVTAKSKVVSELTSALADGIAPFPFSASVACQGVPGAYSQIAADKMFDVSDITYVKDWNAVFSAVEKGLCEYGVLPIENSTVGSVNAVYDLMRSHNFYIVKGIKLRIRHCIMAKRGTTLADIKEIYSHEQAINQCSNLINTFNGVKIRVCDNTAHAAKQVAESENKGVACIASPACASIYGLSVLGTDVQDNNNNYTRFIIISKKLRIFEDANKISIMLNLPHETGSLNKLLNRFSALGLNLTKLESRPIGASPFEFAFYFDFEAKITYKEVRNLLAELESCDNGFVFLGSYSETNG